MFPVAHVTAELFEGAETPVVDDGQRERAQHAHVQSAYRLALAEREEQPIRHVELFPAAFRHVRVYRHPGRVRVLSVQHGSRVFQQLSCRKRKSITYLYYTILIITYRYRVKV